MIVLDTSFAVALLSRSDSNHESAVRWYGTTDEDFATTPLALAEIDYLAATRVGAAARAAFRRDLAAGAYIVGWWPEATVAAVQIAERYSDLGVSLTDASLVALAARLEATTIATFDERHFRALRPLAGASAFTLVPTDA